MTLRDYTAKCSLKYKAVLFLAPYRSNTIFCYYRDCTFNELPFCIQVSIKQILTNLEAIKQGHVKRWNKFEALKRTGFMPFSANTKKNIPLGSEFKIHDKYIEYLINEDTVDYLIKETNAFIGN